MNVTSAWADALLSLWLTQLVPELASATAPGNASAWNQVWGGMTPTHPQGATNPMGPPPTLAQDFARAASATGLSPQLLEAVARQESGFNPASQSPAGAVGVMQLMPGTARELGVNPANAAENISGGAHYLAELLVQFKSLPLALAAYNAGPGAVERYGGVPPYAQTQHYVHDILASLSPRSGAATRA
ncbi:MAG: lytic transglycosylase domain-containing protein [Thermaerobacter sp.]|nr:lytic transglycosylase domain-containing protein [Thermaerobacter sp.]